MLGGARIRGVVAIEAPLYSAMPPLLLERAFQGREFIREVAVLGERGVEARLRGAGGGREARLIVLERLDSVQEAANDVVKGRVGVDGGGPRVDGGGPRAG